MKYSVYIIASSLGLFSSYKFAYHIVKSFDIFLTKYEGTSEAYLTIQLKYPSQLIKSLSYVGLLSGSIYALRILNRN
jgi:hypothetical protein